MTISEENQTLPAGGGDIARRLSTLIEASQALAELETLDDILPLLISQAREVTNSEAASLMLLDQEKQVLHFRVVENEKLDPENARRLEQVELKLGQGIAGSVAAKRRAEIINDVSCDPRFFQGADQKSGFVTKNMMCTPLLLKDDLLGVATVINAKGRKSFQAQDLDLFQSFARLASVAIQRSQLLARRLEQQRLEDDASHAGHIQQLFWPNLPPATQGSSVWAVCQPARFVGGDIYDLIVMPDGSWLFYVADVSGKGMAAALIMAALSSRLKGEVMFHQQPDDLLALMNNAMHQLSEGSDFFVTMILGRYWPQTGLARLVRAGHPPPFWFKGGRYTKPPDTGGLILGPFENLTYENYEISLNPGDSLLFFTDGVGEAMNENQELFERKALEGFLADPGACPHGPKLLEQVRRWQGGTAPSDDLTLLEIWRS